MKENKEEMNQDAISPDAGDQPTLGTRREMIARYGKVAIVAAPLLIFVSKARAIHSRP